MTIIDPLARASGLWEGANGFRLMPEDELFTSPATASVETAARGNLVTFGYTWSHPEDGPQQGLIAVGHAEDERLVVGLWSDSWHQPAAQPLAGSADGTGLSFEYQYADGWSWRIIVTPGPDDLRLQMLNVVPDSEAGEHASAGPYEAMVMDLHRGKPA